jgi:stearoyl-CoA desaturase (delta-9 desaturase)
MLAFAVAFVALGAGNTIGYHRLFTHRAFRARPWTRGALAVLGALHAGPPLLWIGLHRLHHLRSDGPDDPHSPRAGFWHAHTGWLLGGAPPVVAALFALSGFGQQARTLVHDLRRLAGTNPPAWLDLCRDLADDPVLAFLERPLVTPALFATQLAGAAWIGGWAGVAWLWALHLLLTNASWAVNSVCHHPAAGRAPHDTGDGSRDVPWLAPLTLGEAYHNAHHRYPRSARHGLDGGFDPSWWAIRGLVALGLASEPWLPKRERRVA